VPHSAVQTDCTLVAHLEAQTATWLAQALVCLKVVSMDALTVEPLAHLRADLMA